VKARNVDRIILTLIAVGLIGGMAYVVVTR